MKLISNRYGHYEVGHDDGQTDYIQWERDILRLAQQFGWKLRRVQRNKRRPCPHKWTDGTARCPRCGVTAMEFTLAAREFLADIAEYQF
jgi:hypothetical protein